MLVSVAMVSAFHWIRSLGAFGIILMALIDNSVIPTPGSVDLLTVFFAARNREIWYWYAVLATAGSVLGGYITYHLGRKGGEAALEKKLSRRRTKAIYEKFESGGFWSIFIPCLMPPPFPMSPFLVAAGAFNYPRNKFLTALAIGRSIRYTLIAYLALVYGRHIMRFVNHYYKPIMWASILFFVGCALVALVLYLKHRNGDAAAKERDVLPPASGAEAKPRVA